MPLVKRKPSSPGVRAMVQVRSPGLHKGKPFGPLLEKKKRISGRNNAGRITVRHRGGGTRKMYRRIDFKRDKDGIPARLERIEYDPNRSAHIALLLYRDGERRYIICPQQVESGTELNSGAEAPIQSGNCLKLNDIPVGSMVHCVELKPGKGAQLARSAGTSAQFVAKEDGYAMLRLRSGTVCKVLLQCRASLGAVSNAEHSLRSLGKAGAKRWRGIRPTVRGVAMNPVDHPHGGGEGRSSGGRHPSTPWGKPTKGGKTRKRRNVRSTVVRQRRRRG